MQPIPLSFSIMIQHSTRRDQAGCFNYWVEILASSNSPIRAPVSLSLVELADQLPMLILKR